MSRLEIALFGGFQAEVDRNPITTFKTDKNRALITYLVVEAEYQHRREALANLFWSDHSESEARNNLRQALYHLNRSLTSELDQKPYLIITPKQVQFNISSDFWIDIIEFGNLWTACRLHHPPGEQLCAECIDRLQVAIELYHGDFLKGFTLPGCSEFTDWQVIQGEIFHRQALTILSNMADYFESNLEYDRLIACTQRKIELEPWRESAYRRQMRALAATGQRERALSQYKTLDQILHRDMGIAPSTRARRLYEKIRDDKLPDVDAVHNKFFRTTNSSISTGSTNFVGRQSELVRLNGHLRESLAYRGQVTFVRGETGSGKTALLHEFARRALYSQDGLLVTKGTCSAYNGLGDPYQPFREALEILLGVAALSYAGAAVSLELNSRLNNARPVILQTLRKMSPELIGTLIPDLNVSEQTNMKALRHLTYSTQKVDLSLKSGISLPYPLPTDHQQFCLYDQVTRLFLTISRDFPLLIILDDLQWLDNASASMFFHLGGHVSGERIMLIGAYRSEDVLLLPNMARKPLVDLVCEFQKRLGNIIIDLSGTDNRAFTGELLDKVPNGFNQGFRENLFGQTGGNVLFVNELLNDMQVRGEVVQDRCGRWISASQIDWNHLPSRVEAVFNEWINRLDNQCLYLLKAASLQGESFTVDVLSQVVGVAEEKIITSLGCPMCKQHLLKCSLQTINRSSNHACYQFRCLLFQKYLSQSLDDVERNLMQHIIAKIQKKANEKL